jgi:eukaryotic-like serine/threonine-protein kinase
VRSAVSGRLIAGRYRLASVIGHGGMGTVWRARDELLNRDVAVKELAWPPDFTDQEREVACRRAVREAQTAAKLSHRNIIRIYDIVEDEDPWIVMEFLPFRSLRDIVREDGPLAPAQAARVGLGILAGLHAAHEAGIVHRDVKPANILVGPDDRVVLTDFGIARAADSATLTNAGDLIGSPSYIAPEHAKGERSGAPGDLWGLGASLYTAVEGRPPFHRGNALATLTAVVADEPDPATRAGPLWPAISALLRKDPAARPDEAELERMLHGVATGESTRAIAEAPIAESPPPAAAADQAVLDRAASEPGASDAAPPAPSAPSGSPAAPAVLAQAPSAAPAASALSDPSPEPAASAPGDSPAQPGWSAPSGPIAAPPGPIAAPPGPIAAPRPRPERSPRRPPWSRRRLALPAAFAVLAAAACAVALLLTNSSPPGRPTAGSPRTGTQSAGARPSASSGSAAAPTDGTTHGGGTPSAGASQPPAASTGPGSGTGNTGSGNSGSGNSGPGNSGSGTVPAGFYRFTNSTGFSIGVPDGWQIQHVGHYVYVNDPSNGNIFLLIDQSDQPKADPLADWRQQAANRAGTYPGYHQIRLESVSYPQAEKAADWEFTYNRDGVPVHILNRNILANAHHAYALYWSVPEAQWNPYYRYFQAFAATFRPAS